MSGISGGEVIARMLQMENVEKVFGIIDGTYFGFYSTLKKYGMDLISPRHETSAAHMAGAYARVTGKLGVCMASNGPGVANLLPGLVVEQGEGNRVLAITSSRRPGVMYPERNGAYQTFDQTGVISKIAKWSVQITSFERIPEIVRKAIRKSFEGRPGVVHLDVPESIMNTKVKTDVKFWSPQQYRKSDPITPTKEQIEKAAEIILSAELPMIHAGSGIIHAQAYEELKNVVDLLQAPITTSWGARGVYPETGNLSIPMYQIKLNQMVRNDADVVLVLGSRLGETDWWGKAPYWRDPSEQKMIQVDIDGEILGANKPAELAIQADVKEFLILLHRRLLERKPDLNADYWKNKIETYVAEKQRYRDKLDRELNDTSSPMNTGHIAKITDEVVPEDTILVADGGNTAVWSNFYHEAKKPGKILSTFKFGMLGAGISQALGAAAANPEKPVICIIGDGAMGFHPQEIETAVRNNLKVIYVVVCDKQWGMVKMNQQIALKPIKTMIKKSLDASETINTDLEEIQFDKLAESMGAHGERVSNPDELKAALKRSLDAGKCAVIHADVDPVKHMWAPGLIHFKDMHMEPRGK